MNLSDAGILALQLLEQHKLHDWCFRLDHARVRFGYCNFTGRVISLSRHLIELNDEKTVRNTILHEIAHALVGKEHSHNKIWKQKAHEIGCCGSRLYCHEEVKVPKRKYTANCPHCKREFQRSIKRRIACGKCCKKHNRGKFSQEFEIVFVENK